MERNDATAEFVGAELGDERLSKRLVKLATRAVRKPDASFPKALTEAELEGAYRFFGNPKVDPEGILGPHLRQTVNRIAEAEVVLALHDTTTLSFRKDGQREGFGALTEKTQQLWTHATLAVKGDETRCPLGMVALSTEASIRHDRWLDNVERANAAVGSSTRLVHVMDREADDFALFAGLLDVKARFVVRLQHDRRVDSDGKQPIKITEALARATVIAEREVVMNARGTDKGSKARRVHPARKARPAKLSIAAAPIVLHAPGGRRDLPRTLELHAVRVWEPDPPPEEPDVEWLLLTSEPIDDVDAMLRVVDWYRARWTIEEYFKALKTGCSIEKRQLESYASFTNAVAFFAPIAWQLLLLRYRAHHEADSDGAASLPDGMLLVLRHIARRPLPQAPSARDVLLAIAALGGHLKRNGDPGWQTLGYGYDKLREAAEIWAIAAKVVRSDQS